MILFIFQLAERMSTNDFLNTFRPTGKCQFVDMKNLIKIHSRNSMYITPPSTNRIVKVEWKERAWKNNSIYQGCRLRHRRRTNERNKQRGRRWAIISLIYFNEKNHPMRKKRNKPMRKIRLFRFFRSIIVSRYILHQNNTRTTLDYLST